MEKYSINDESNSLFFEDKRMQGISLKIITYMKKNRYCANKSNSGHREGHFASVVDLKGE